VAVNVEVLAGLRRRSATASRSAPRRNACWAGQSVYSAAHPEIPLPSNFFERRQAALEQKYRQDLADFNLQRGGGATLQCPYCAQSFYIALPEHCPETAVDPFRLSCAAACGHASELPGYSPRPYHGDLAAFDTVLDCPCGNRSAANGSCSVAPSVTSRIPAT